MIIDHPKVMLEGYDNDGIYVGHARYAYGEGWRTVAGGKLIFWCQSIAEATEWLRLQGATRVVGFSDGEQRYTTREEPHREK